MGGDGGGVLAAFGPHGWSGYAILAAGVIVAGTTLIPLDFAEGCSFMLAVACIAFGVNELLDHMLFTGVAVINLGVGVLASSRTSPVAGVANSWADFALKRQTMVGIVSIVVG